MKPIHAIISLVVFLAASCAAAKPKPAPIPAPAPSLIEEADGADAARVLEARAAVETARLRFLSALAEFERKYKISTAKGEGWDEVDADGNACTSINNCKLRLRRIPAPTAPKASSPAK